MLIVDFGWYFEKIKISSFVKIINVLLVSDKFILDKLFFYYIWIEKLISDCLKFKF